MCNRVGEIRSGFSLPEGSKVTKGLSPSDMCVWWHGNTHWSLEFSVRGVGMMKESMKTGNSLQILLTSSPPNPREPLY